MEYTDYRAGISVNFFSESSMESLQKKLNQMKRDPAFRLISIYFDGSKHVAWFYSKFKITSNRSK